MISVSSAEKIILESLKPFPYVVKPLQESFGAVLREDILADRPLPAFNKSLMDGIAIRFKSWQRGVRAYDLKGIQPAGKPALTIRRENECVEIMTGAVLPSGLDCVIPIEFVTIKAKKAFIKNHLSVKKLQFIHQEGKDHRKGDLLLQKGYVLTPPRIGIAASVGRDRIRLSAKPKIAIISTGDELVDVAKKPKLYQTRISNSYALKSAFDLTNLFDSDIFHLRDNKKEMYRKLKTLIGSYDVLVLSGGVSMGKFDYVPQVLKQLGVKTLFHKVTQKPGKPFWFGMYKEKKPVFALPGNPVSTIVCAYRYVLPALRQALGLKIRMEYVSVQVPPQSHKHLTIFLPVRVKNSQLKIVSLNNSGDFASLADTDGFIEVAANNNKRVYKFFPWA